MSRRSARLGRRQPTPGRLLPDLARVDALIEDDQIDAAADLIADLDRRFPNHPEVIGRSMNVALATDDMHGYTSAAERLTHLLPNDPDLAVGLAGGYLATQRFAHARRAFAAALKRWPNYPRTSEIRQQITDLDTLLQGLWNELAFEGPFDLEACIQHEEVQELVTAGDWQPAIRLAEQALRRRPEFAAIRNNLSLAYHALGQFDKAIATAQEVLARDPQNLYGMGNLARFLVLAGRLDDARRRVEQLQSIPIENVDTAVKQAEMLSFLGDDVGVLAVFERARKLPNRDFDTIANAMLHHLSAVAALRQGRLQAARRRWNKALELEPGLEVASDNLHDLELPRDDRNAPWAYGIEDWLPTSVIDNLFKELRPDKGYSEEVMSRNARRFLERHPFVAQLVPMLLDRGDPLGRELALRLAMMAATPELLEALRDFALGQHGPAELRLQAAQQAIQAGLLPNGMVRFWQNGTWNETFVLGFEITGEAMTTDLPAHLHQLQQDAAIALSQGDLETSEQLLKQALAEAPDDPALLNNLGATYANQGRIEQAREMFDRLYERHPDYLLARTNRVVYLVQDGKLEEAQELITPLLGRHRLHMGEFNGLMSAQISIYLAQGNITVARSWLDMWEGINPENPAILFYRRQLRSLGRKKRPKNP